MMFSNLYFITCSVGSLCYLGGVIFFFTDHKPTDSCEMTYMFEYPQYVKVSQELDEKYPKYGLYAYGEGRITSRARNMDFDGIPVLFIPGNAGSYQQVRSLSSVALRKALNSRTGYHFDYFTVKLNAEYSALYGPVLNEQLEYVNSSLFRVLELYKKKKLHPNQVILIGHSVGGVIAKKLLSTLSPESKLVPLLIALATPFKRPLIKFDRYLSDFYKMDSSHHRDTNIISIAGGYSDFLIPTYLTEINQSNALNLVSTNIAKSWVESHHVQIVWCKQTVLAINRALFDIVDPKTKQIYPSKNYRDKVFKHHFIQNSGTKIHLKSDPTEPYQIDHKGEWSESLLKQYFINFPKGLREPRWYMVALTNTPGYEILSILAVNMEVTNWIFACNAAYPKGPSRVCISGLHLTHFSEIVPSHFYKRRLITLNLHELKKNNTQLTHIVFRALPTSKPLSYHIDIHGVGERKVQVTLPSLLTLGKQTVAHETPAKAIIYELELENLWNMLQFYVLSVEPISCNHTEHHATISLIVPWANQNLHQPLTDNARDPFYLRLQCARPKNSPPPLLRITLDPRCTYKISVRLSIAGMFGQIARYYYPLLITNVAVVFLQTFRSQLESLSKTEKCPVFFFGLKDILKQHWVLAVAFFLGKYAIYVPLLNKILPQADADDFPHAGNNLVDFFTVHVLLYMISIVIVFLLVSAYSVSLFALESTVHKLALKLLARSVTFNMQFSDYFMSFLQKVPLVVVGVLIFLCLSTCGGLALCVGMVFYFLKLTQMSQDYIENVAWFVVKSFAKRLKISLSRRQNDTTNEQTNYEVIKAIENNVVNKEKCDLDEAGCSRNKGNADTINDTKNNDLVDKQKNDNEENTNLEKDKSDTTYEESVEDENKDAKNNGDTSEESLEKNEQTDEPPRSQNQDDVLSTAQKKDNESIMNSIKADFNPIFFHSTLFFIWVMIMLLNLPAVLTWAHNFTYSKVLSPDESFIPGLILSLCALPLWHLELPRTNRKYFHELSSIILVLIVLILAYATISLYRLNYVLTLTFALVVLQQLLAPKSREVDEVFQEKDEQKRQEKKYDDFMKKID